MTTCTAWGLSYRDPANNSDKFYRTYAVGPYCVFQWGRRGSLGQFKVLAMDSQGEATSTARSKAQEKRDAGYVFDNPQRCTFDVPDAQLRHLPALARAVASSNATAARYALSTYLNDAYHIAQVHSAVASSPNGNPAVTPSATPDRRPRAAKPEHTVEDVKNKLLAMHAKLRPAGTEPAEPPAPELTGMEAKLAAALKRAKEAKK